MMNYLVEVIDEIKKESRKQKDYQTTTRDLAQSLRFQGRNVGVETSQGVTSINPKGLANFLTILGMSRHDVSKKYLKSETRRHIVMDASENIPDIPIMARLNSKDEISTVVKVDKNFSNWELAEGLQKFIEEGIIPYTAQVKGFVISDSAHRVDFRIFDKSWDIGDCYAGIKFTNYEFVTSRVQPAIARVSCFNWTLAEAQYEINPQNIRQAFEHMRQYAEKMFEQIELSKNIEFADPSLVFRKIAAEFKLPEGVVSRALAYHERENQTGSVYEILQAITDGSKWLTEKQGRKKIDWQQRNKLETEMFNWIVTMNEIEDAETYISGSAFVRREDVVDILTSRNEWSNAADYIKNLEPVFV